MNRLHQDPRALPVPALRARLAPNALAHLAVRSERCRRVVRADPLGRHAAPARLGDLSELLAHHVALRLVRSPFRGTRLSAAQASARVTQAPLAAVGERIIILRSAKRRRYIAGDPRHGQGQILPYGAPNERADQEERDSLHGEQETARESIEIELSVCLEKPFGVLFASDFRHVTELR